MLVKHVAIFSFRQMKESGQLHRLNKKWERRFRQDCLSSEEVRALSIKDVFAAFVVLLTGFLVSTLLFQVEKLYKVYWGTQTDNILDILDGEELDGKEHQEYTSQNN